MRSRRAAVIAAACATVVVALVCMQAWQEKTNADHRIGILLPSAQDVMQISSVVPGLPADRAGFLAGDIIVRIGDTPVVAPSDYDAPARDFHRGQDIEFEIIRDGQSLTLSARPGAAFPWGGFLLDLAATLSYLALGLVALLQNPGDIRARLLFAFSVAVALELALPFTFDLIPVWSLAATGFFYLLTGIQMGLELHLAQVIPRRFEWSTRRRWLVPVYYGIGLTLGAVTCTAVLTEGFNSPVFPWSAQQAAAFLDSWGLTCWALAVVIILIIQLKRTQNARHHAQAMLVLVGVIPWAVLTLALEVGLAFNLAVPPWFDPVQATALLIYPVAVFCAIFRFHLFDIEFVLRRSLVFTMVTGAMVVLFYVAFSVASALFASHAEDGGLSVGALSLSMLVLGLLFLPIRRSVQAWLDRRLFPERVAMRQRLADLASELPAHGNLPAMGRHLVTQLCDIFSFSSATLLVADPSSRLLVTLASTTKDPDRHFGQSFLLEPDDPGVRILSRAARPLPASSVTGHSPALAQRLHAFGADFALGLNSGGSLAGLLLLGPKTIEEKLGSEEQELLSLFSHMVATVLENVRLFESATFESLTGLLRREAILSALERELHRALRYRRPLTVGMADIDHFKRVNDEHGHLAGDALLKQVAHALNRALRASDAIGRYGGEEFLFFLPETDVKGAVQVAEKLRTFVEDLTEPLEEVDGLSVTISIGLTELDHDADPGATITSLISAADENLLRAKREGRNRVVPGPLAAA